MKLNKGDKVKGGDSVYIVIAVLWTTVYLKEMENTNTDFLYEMREVQEYYNDIEILRKSNQHNIYDDVNEY